MPSLFTLFYIMFADCFFRLQLSGTCLHISMDLDLVPTHPTPPAPRKVRFAPKPPPRRTPTPVPAKIETAVEDDADHEATGQNSSRRVIDELMNRRNAKAKAKIEQKSPVQVAFSHGVASAAIQSYGKRKIKIDDKSDVGMTKDTLDEKDPSSLFMKKNKREYEEPWDYYSSYPVSVPLRRPYSGNPDVLNIEEFEDALVYDENYVSSALGLGLLDEDDTTPSVLLFKFPPYLPLGSSRLSRATKGKEIVGSSVNQRSRNPPKKSCTLEELPKGYMGKMVVYRSGAVKLKLGDLLYDVSPGTDCSSAQNAMAINTSNRHCCELGEVNKRAVVTPDIGSLLDKCNVIDLVG